MKKIFFAALTLACAAAVASCSNSGATTITKGNESKMDSLSYCLGANIGFGVSGEMSDIPFNIDLVKKGIEEGALDKAEQTQEAAVDILREYFMNKRNERKLQLDEQKKAAEADSTVVVDNSIMFESPAECDEVSYAFGNDIGNNVRASKLPLQTYWLNKGFADAFEGYSEISEGDVQSFLQNYFMVVRPAQVAKASEEWLAKMEKKSGVKKTESGLLYKVVKSGDMATAATDDRDVVVVKYEGKTKDGEVFDSSYERVEEIEKQIAEVKKNKDLTNEQKAERTAQLEEEKANMETIEFPLNRVIKGWTEGMKLVGKGGKIILYIPSELAYGPRGAGRAIGPNEALEFTVELIDVKPFEEPKPAEEAATEEAAPAEETK